MAGPAVDAVSTADPQGAASETRPPEGRARTAAAFVLVFATGTFLRLSTILSRGLWLDEAVTVRQTSGTLWKAVRTQIEGVHPPLFHVLMHLWVGLWGLSEFALRSYALLFGVACIPAAFWAGSALYDRRTGLISAGIAAFSPYLIWYSQEARMYSMLGFFALLSVTTLALAVRDNRPGRWAAYFISTMVGLFTHYFFVVLFAGEVLYFVAVELVGGQRSLRREGRSTLTLRRPWRVFQDNPRLAPWLLVTASLTLLLAAWMARSIFYTPGDASAASPLVSSAVSQGLGYGQASPSLALRFNDVAQVLVAMLVGYHARWLTSGLVAAWPLLVYLSLLLVDYAGPAKRETKVLLYASSGIPLLWLFGQWQGQVLAARYFIALASPAVLLAGRVLALTPDGARRKLLLALTALMLVAWLDQSIDPDNLMRHDQREAIRYVADAYRPGDAVLYEPFYVADLFDYYLPEDIEAHGFPQVGHGGVIREGKARMGQDLERVVGASPRVWLVLSFQDIAKMRGDAYNTKKWLVRNGFEPAKHRSLHQVEVFRYDRSQTDTEPVGGFLQ